MIKLPKVPQDPKSAKNVCKCRPVCKSRRREWKGEVQHTSAELLLERKPLPECFRRWPTNETVQAVVYYAEQVRVDLHFTHLSELQEELSDAQKVYPNSPCPLFGKTRRVTVKERGVIEPPTVVRICQAPLDDTVDTPYLKYAQLADRLGAMSAVQACCAFCSCVGCCACQPSDYRLRDEDRAASRRLDMRVFDARVKRDCQPMRIMYQ